MGGILGPQSIQPGALVNDFLDDGAGHRSQFTSGRRDHPNDAQRHAAYCALEREGLNPPADMIEPISTATKNQLAKSGPPYRGR